MTIFMRAFFAVSAFSIALSSATVACAQSAARPVLVELFTSEGCSSCPPADALLRRVADQRTQSGQLMVVLSEHVTYWNGLGWADPFSKNEFTERQNRYGARFRLDSVYTPQIVVNGSRELLGSDERALLRAVSAQSAGAPEMLQVRGVERHGQNVDVRYTAVGPIAKGTELFAVVADNMDTTQVPRGENAGRSLQHVAVARSMMRVGMVQPGEGLIHLTLAESAGAQHVVLFAQADGQGAVSSVAEASLPGSLPQATAMMAMPRQ